MCAHAVLKVAHCQGCAGSGDSTGAFSDANRLNRLPSSLQERALVQRAQQRADRRIGGMHVDQHSVAQAGQDPPGDDLHRALCSGFVLGQQPAPVKP